MAVEPTASPIWRIGEVVPVIGENFRAVRVIAEGVDEVSREIVNPAVGLVGSFGVQRDPATGGFDLAPLREATEIVTTADQVVTALHEHRVDRHGCHDRAGRRAVTEFDEMLGSAEDTIPQLQGAIAGVGALLGVDGPKNVVLAFLNNAEASALGGGPASQTLLRVENGTVNIDRQVNSNDFRVAVPVDVPVDESAKQLYDSIFTDNLNAATSRPDFPTAASIISAHWQREQAVTPDIVVSIDPIALSRILEVTGPVALPNGEQLDSGNVVSKLLNEAYFTYPEGGDESDAYFASAATAVFDRMMSVDYDIYGMAQAFIDSANRGTLMMWSADPATQELFDDTRLQGVLPKTNEGATVVGVYFRDRCRRRSTTTCAPRRRSRPTRARPMRPRTPSTCA